MKRPCDIAGLFLFALFYLPLGIMKKSKHNIMKYSSILVLFALSVVISACNTVAQEPAGAPFAQSDLPYAFNALEPHIDAQTMEIHYTRHHAGYTKKLNAALEEAGETDTPLEEILAGVSQYGTSVRNNGGGHYNHDLFWSVLTPETTEPSAALLDAVNAEFGSMDELKSALSAAGATRFGSGWAWLIVTPSGELAVTSTANQDNPLMDVVEEKGTPILGIDVWEHAYYLKYQNKRGDYLDAIWNVLNWNEVSRRYELATDTDS